MTCVARAGVERGVQSPSGVNGKVAGEIRKLTAIDIDVRERFNIDGLRSDRSGSREKISARKCPEICRALIAVDLDIALRPKADLCSTGNRRAKRQIGVDAASVKVDVMNSRERNFRP